MDYSLIIVVALVIIGFLILKRMSLVPEQVARQQLHAGALVIDVRSPAEFQGGHVPNAVNIPLGTLSAELPRRVIDRNEILLFHCLSGGRSAIAKHQAKRLGYRNAFNLGSFSRAERVALMKRLA
jgi:phage shock protein E